MVVFVAIIAATLFASHVETICSSSSGAKSGAIFTTIGLRITRLSFRSDRADFNETKAKRSPGRQCYAILVQTGGKTNWIWEIQTEKFFRFCRWLKNAQRAQGKIDM